MRTAENHHSILGVMLRVIHFHAAFICCASAKLASATRILGQLLGGLRGARFQQDFSHILMLSWDCCEGQKGGITMCTTCRSFQER